jgi:hypothetical protein
MRPRHQEEALARTRQVRRRRVPRTAGKLAPLADASRKAVQTGRPRGLRRPGEKVERPRRDELLAEQRFREGMEEIGLL